MAEAATILVPALVTVSVALSAVARKLDLVALAHDDVAPFSPTGGTLPFLDKLATDRLENIDDLKHRIGDPVTRSEQKIQDLETELRQLKGTDEDTDVQQEKIKRKIEGYRKSKRMGEKYNALEKRFAEKTLEYAEWYKTAVVYRIWPRLGLFTFLHILNIELLWFAFLSIDAVVGGGPVYTISKVSIAVLWVLFPILEVPDYNRIIAANELYPSVPYYVIVTGVTIVYSQFFRIQVLAVTLLLVLNMYYLHLLKSELENVEID